MSRYLLLLASLITALVVAGSPAAASSTGLTMTEVSIPVSGGKTLTGTVYAPRTAAGPLPGLVLVHGSGNGKRAGLAAEAAAFAQQGMAVLAYDKRPLDQPEYSLLADDAVAAAGVLRAHPGVNPAAVGLWGISEGGWVMPIAAGRSPEIAFLVLASAPAQSPIRVQNWNMRNKLAAAGVAGALTDTLSDRFYRLANDANLFAEADYDPRPALSALTRPVLAVYGTDDTQVPPAESIAELRRSVSAPLTVRTLPGAGHTLRVLDGHGMYTDRLYPGYAQLVGEWVRATATGTAPAAHADPAPAQQALSAELTRSRWWESWPAQLTALGVFLIGFLAYPVVAAVRRLRRRTVAVTRPARVLAVAGTTAVLGFVAYFVTVLDGANWRGISPGPAIAGRPVIWLALQAVALVTVIAAVMTAHAWRTARGDRLRLGFLLAGGALFLPWALYWGLLLP
ncbi:prolyl oligopeptidase family serine peptidase [Actinoplanes sp. NPDC024001]|uniref:alpha/beta hydrolase family protein n=1 Tax=Actinoplanes sp. NPDC024001 TaxID=3154598 RepID=UPI0033EEA764